MRLLWFLDFVYAMVHYLREHPNVSATRVVHCVGHTAEGGARGIRRRPQRSTQHARAQRIQDRGRCLSVTRNISLQNIGRSHTHRGG